MLRVWHNLDGDKVTVPPLGDSSIHSPCTTCPPPHMYPHKLFYKGSTLLNVLLPPSLLLNPVYHLSCFGVEDTKEEVFREDLSTEIYRFPCR